MTFSVNNRCNKSQMGKSCEQLTDHCRHVIVVVKWLLFSHSSYSHVYSSENKWGLVLCLWVEYNSSFFMGKEAGSCKLLVLCLILHFHLRTTLSWGGNTGNQMLVGSRSISWRIRAWKMSSLDEYRSTSFFCWDTQSLYRFHCQCYFSIYMGLFNFSSIIHRCTKPVMATIHYFKNRNKDL